jgi:16S rRNA (uracil1498-N3)-methyltransferase
MEAGWGEKKTGKISLAVSPLRQKDRFEWLVEKAVELGIDEIIPLSCKHSITENIKPERIQSIITSAAKQCKRALFPVLHPIMPFQSFIETPKNSLNFIGYCESKEEIANFHAEIIAAPSIMLCIGPEGDFSPQEIKMATEHEFHAISLGESRLRTETAGVFGISVIKFLKRY